MRVRLLLAACAIGAATPASAEEPFIGRWGANACTGDVLVASQTSLSWLSSSCRIGRMYKVKDAFYVQVNCFGSGDIPVVLATQGDRMQVTWNRQRLPDMQRCK
jgi:hypothetical protein